jgi:hypothetical protein
LGSSGKEKNPHPRNCASSAASNGLRGYIYIEGGSLQGAFTSIGTVRERRDYREIETYLAVHPTARGKDLLCVTPARSRRASSPPSPTATSVICGTHWPPKAGLSYHAATSSTNPKRKPEPIVTGNFAAMEAAMAADAAAAEEQSVRTGGTLAPGGG